MTLWAARKPGSRDLVTVSMTYGPITAQVEESTGHLTSFWHELGKLVAAQDNEARAKAGYGRYLLSCGGVSVHGEPLPSWEDQMPEIREHWTAAFTE